MATRLQWVNYPDADKAIGGINVKRADLVDGDVTSVAAMSTRAYVSVTFKKKDRNTLAALLITPDGGNAAYSATERARGGGIFAPGLLAVSKIGKKGAAKFPIRLTPAGGDKFSFKARSLKGTEKTCTNQLETRRKLFYQVVTMKKARRPSDKGMKAFEAQFWKPGKKLYIKLERYSSGRTIANRVNFDDTDPAVQTAVKNALRKKYDRKKAPFAVVALMVNRNCIPKREIQSVPVVFAGGKYALATIDVVFKYADPGVAWFHGMTFTPAAGGPVNVPPGKVRLKGKRALEIDTAGLPHGAGTLDYDVTVVDIEGMGLSLPTENLVTIASRGLDGKVPKKTMAAIMVHEVGHKIGMVPGPQGDPDLDQQSTYYDGHGHQGGHCRHPAPLVDYATVNPVPAPTCTMFGDIRTDTLQFCPHCLKSVRKLDVSPDRKVGIATQF